MTATGIPLRDLHLVWADLWPLLEPAVKRTPDKPDVLARLIACDAQLWAVYPSASLRAGDSCAPVAAIVTQITIADEKRCRLWLVGGSRVRDWIGDFLAKVEDWARSLGCVALWASGREGWARIVNKFGGRGIGTVDGFPAWERRL